MSSAQAILVGAILIAASILFVNTIRPAEAQHEGPYLLAQNGNTAANSSVFRIDSSSGDVSFCFVDRGQLSCTGYVH